MKAKYIDSMGSDLTCVNAARVSFDSISTELSKKDINLIKFLARGCMSKEWDTVIHDLYEDVAMTYEDIENTLKWAKNMPTHWSPFAHAMITVRETVPIFVARQRFKHTVGFAYNEISRRYVDDTPKFYYPREWRARPEGSVKQGSGDMVVDSFSKYPNTWGCKNLYEELMDEIMNAYRYMLDKGVAPEQARMILPQSMYTEYYVTGSLAAWARAYIQRSDSHAQSEIQELASQWDNIIKPLFPVSWEALTK